MIGSAYVSRFLASAALAAALVLSANLAGAAAVSNGDYIGKTEAEMSANLEQQGYEVLRTETEDGNLEAEAVLEGKTYEIYADPRTGQIVEIEEGGEDDEKEGSFIKRLLRIGGDDD